LWAVYGFILIGNMWMYKDSTNVEKADIQAFVITECNRAQRALWTVWGSVHCDCGLCVELL